MFGLESAHKLVPSELLVLLHWRYTHSQPLQNKTNYIIVGGWVVGRLPL